MEPNLPKGYLSHTQIDTWLKDKKRYRRMYYEGKPMYMTPELEFGKRIAQQYEMLHSEENWPVDHIVIRKIPRGTKAEYELRASIRGVPLLGFVDSYDENSGKIHELKTGKTPWTQARVDKHNQLRMYALILQKIHGRYNPYAALHWLPTESRTTSDVIDGMSFTTNDIVLTGDIQTFNTTIMALDVFEYGRLILDVAHDIKEDWSIWKRLHPPKDQKK